MVKGILSVILEHFDNKYKEKRKKKWEKLTEEERKAVNRKKLIGGLLIALGAVLLFMIGVSNS